MKILRMVLVLCSVLLLSGSLFAASTDEGNIPTAQTTVAAPVATKVKTARATATPEAAIAWPDGVSVFISRDGKKGNEQALKYSNLTLGSGIVIEKDGYLKILIGPNDFNKYAFDLIISENAMGGEGIQNKVADNTYSFMKAELSVFTDNSLMKDPENVVINIPGAAMIRKFGSNYIFNMFIYEKYAAGNKDKYKNTYVLSGRLRKCLTFAVLDTGLVLTSPIIYQAEGNLSEFSLKKFSPSISAELAKYTFSETYIGYYASINGMLSVFQQDNSTFSMSVGLQADICGWFQIGEMYDIKNNCGRFVLGLRPDFIAKVFTNLAK